MNTRPVAIVPARGGSRRLARKNILPVLNRPMLSYPVKAALDSGCFEQIIVSSEDPEILDIVSPYDCRPLKRPENIARDTSRIIDVCGHVLDVLAGEGRNPEFFCVIYATAIFLKPDDFTRSLALFSTDPLPDVVMGVSAYNLQPMQALFEDAHGFSRPRWPDEIRKQSQNHPQFFASNGTLIWVRSDHFRNTRSFYPQKLKAYQIPWYRAIDIDTPEDYDLAGKLAPLFLSQ